MKIALILLNFFLGIQQKEVYLMFYEDAETEVQQKLVYQTGMFYGTKMKIIFSKPLPTEAYYKPRNRYKAETLLEDLLKVDHPYNEIIVGVTSRDISTDKEGKDWGICGMGVSGAAVISSYRLKKGSEEEQYNKLLNVTLHEMGHAYGLPHCTNKACLMQDAEGKINLSYLKYPFLCDRCRAKIK